MNEKRRDTLTKEDQYFNCTFLQPRRKLMHVGKKTKEGKHVSRQETGLCVVDKVVTTRGKTRTISMT